MPGILDDFGRILGDESHRDWLDSHPYDLETWMYDNIAEPDIIQTHFTAEKFPWVFRMILESEDMTEKEKVNIFLKQFRNPNKPPLILVFGDVGSGKTGFEAWLCERLRKERPIATMGVNVPFPYSQDVHMPQEAENNSVIIMSEAGMAASARTSMSSMNQMINDFDSIRRHKNVAVIADTQDPNFLDINLFRLCTGMVFKPMSMIVFRSKAKDMTNQEIRGMQLIQVFLKIFPPKTTEEGWSDEFLFIGKNEVFKAHNNIPKWFTEGFSKQYQKVITPIEAWEHAKKMMSLGVNPPKIRNKLQLMGIYWSVQDIQHFTSPRMTEEKFKDELFRRNMH